MTIEQPARLFAQREHGELIRGLNRIRDLACSIGHVPTAEVSDGVITVVHWIEHTLWPHLAWEEHWLYPEIELRLETPWATRAARFDHGQLRERSDRLRFDRLGLTADLHGAREELRGDLFGFEALVRAHIEREEQFLLPLLDEPVTTELDPAAVAPV
ncbi:MAG TPA: hemerythrin domain-containing protein [Candidatus Limnocylindrales bacterium]|nr:hemerythrin domain-containing protein [Candidatus Limnocylindrales bacterium]